MSARILVPIKQSERDMWWTLYSGGIPIKGIGKRFQRGYKIVQEEIKLRRDATGTPVIRQNVTAPELRGKFLADYGQKPHISARAST